MYALMELQVESRHCRTDVLTEVERVQLQFWEAMHGRSMDNSLVFFDVSGVVSLQTQFGSYLELSDIAAHRRRGNFFALNNVEVAHCYRPGIAPGDIHNVCV